MIRVVVVLAAGLAVSGCVTSNVVWTRPGATSVDFDREKMQCEYEAKLATPGRYSGRGMGNAIADGISDGMRMNELGTMCMQTKGWTRQVADASGRAPVQAAYTAPEPAARRNLKPAEATAEARKHLAAMLGNPRFADVRSLTTTSAVGDPTDVVCGAVNGKPFVYFVDQRETNIVDGAEADVNRGIYRSYCERPGRTGA